METMREQDWETDWEYWGSQEAGDGAYPSAESAQDAAADAEEYLVDPDAPRERAKRFLNNANDNVKAKAHNAGGVIKDKAYSKAPNRLKNASDLQLRFRSGFLYIAISVVCVLASDITTVIYLALVGAICAGEFYAMMRSDAKLVNEWMGIAAAICYPVFVFLWGVHGAMGVTVLFMMALVIWYVFWQRARITDVCLSFFGAAYMGLTLSCLILLRDTLEPPWGGVLLLVLLMSVWFNDVGAYLVGSRIGKHKMAPLISPKKSWEGFAGGLVVSVLFWCVIRMIPGVNMNVPEAIVFGIVCGAMSVLGDLVESRIKRNVGVKDSGTIMPGHGGLFDRSDSLFTAAFAAFMLLVVGGCVNFVW